MTEQIVVNRKNLVRHITHKGTCLCVGLDTDISKIPEHLLEEEDPMYAFNVAIIDATADYCVAFKPNLAFYEAYGSEGFFTLEKTVTYIKEHYPNHLVIADAKRADIGNTSAMYAKGIFETLGADAITLSPYMGCEDSLSEFLKYEHKWSIVLALTSNKGANDFQHLRLTDYPDKSLHEFVIEKVVDYGSPKNLMFVVGATQSDYLQEIRKIIPEHFLLVPGVGKQGGSLEDVCKFGMNSDCGILINSSREIIYASNGKDFAEAAAAKAKETSDKIRPFIEQLNLPL